MSGFHIAPTELGFWWGAIILHTSKHLRPRRNAPYLRDAHRFHQFTTSREQFLDRLPAIDQRHRSPGVRVESLMWVDTHLGVEGACQILGRMNVLRCVIAFHIGRPQDVTPWRPGSRHRNGHSMRPMVASTAFVYLRSTAKLAQRQH